MGGAAGLEGLPDPVRRPHPLWTLLTAPAALVAAPLLGIVFTVRNLVVGARGGLWPSFAGVLNLPFDLLTNTLGFISAIGFYPLFARGPERPGIGLCNGSLIFLGGPLGAGVSKFASGFTPTSTVFITRKAWERSDDERRDRLINHELWHARRQFLRYSGWIFWPAYLVSNLTHGVHRKNPFESGRNGAYANVDDCWGDFCRSPHHVHVDDLFIWGR